MQKIATLANKAGELYDFYISTDMGRTFYNLVPAGSAIPDGGYFELPYLFKTKGF